MRPLLTTMPRHRAILVIWLIGTFLALGAWGHSLLRNSSIAWASRSGNQLLRVGTYLGTFAIDLGYSSWRVSPGLRFESVDYKPKTVPGHRNVIEHVDYFVGPFGEFDCYSTDGSWSIALPLWFLLLLFTAVCLPFYLRARKKARQSPFVVDS